MTQEPANRGAPRSKWVPCPPGEFQQLSSRLRHRRQRRLFLRGTAAAVLVGTSGLSLWFGLGRRSASTGDPGQLSCEQVAQLATAYRDHELAPALRERVRQHVSVCPRCGPRFRAMGIFLQ
jgi:hypothetical protein